MQNKKLLVAGSVAGAAIAAALAVPSLANHSWNDYHWQTSNGVATPDVVDNTVGSWKPRVAIAMADWNKSNNIDSALLLGSTNQKRCPMVSGTIQVCNSAYGQTGWLGIASISLSSGHIVAGSTKLNDTYFSYPQYNTEAWKQLVTCQEIGHDYGLGHQNEDFATDATDSCMEYTSDPSGNTHPDAHDYQQLATLYHGGDGGGSSTSGGSSGKPGKGGGNGGGKGKPLGIEPGDSPAQWGRAVGKDTQGRPNEFVRNFNGYTVITHVTWAPHVSVPEARH